MTTPRCGSKGVALKERQLQLNAAVAKFYLGGDFGEATEAAARMSAARASLMTASPGGPRTPTQVVTPAKQCKPEGGQVGDEGPDSGR